MQPTERLRSAVRAQALSGVLDPQARAALEQVLRAGAGSVLGVIFYGSRKTLSSRDPWSACDFFVLVRDYPTFYRALREGSWVHRPPWLLAALNAVMPPSQVRLSGPGESRLSAKCAVIRLDALVRATSARRRDHFCAARLFQPVAIVHADDDGAREMLVDCLAQAHALTYGWVRPWLPARFDVATYCRTLLRVSFSWEIRPEPAARADELFAAQRQTLEELQGVLLDDLARAGELCATSEGFTLARPPGRYERRRNRWYFRHSLMRATSRWLKHVVTHEGWLEHLVHKAERHGGRPVELTSRERRWPLVFLWPRVLRHLREKDRR